MPGPGHLCDGTLVTIRDRIDGSLAALTPLSVADAAAWTRWLNDISTTRYLYGRRERPSGPVTMREMLVWGRRMLADPIRLAVGIEDLSSGQVVGNARLVPVFGGRSRFSIVIGEAESRGRGLGTEATRMLCRYGFEQMGIREIILDVDPRNEPAIRAYRSVGFVPSRGWTMRLPAAAARAAPRRRPGRAELTAEQRGQAPLFHATESLPNRDVRQRRPGPVPRSARTAGGAGRRTPSSAGSAGCRSAAR